jgi:hypothetical protein
MADNAHSESFGFVDKRKVNTSSPEVDDADTAPSAPDFDLDAEPAAGDETSIDPLAAYGLAAYVTGMIASEAWQKLGLMADPSTGKVNPDLEQARFCIDCVAALIGVIDKHQGVMPAELQRDLQRVLNDLRLNFVEQSRRQGGGNA